MNNWNIILDDFARKCKGGAPDMTNPRHLALLRESLIKFGWKENATNEFIGNLREGEDKDYKGKGTRTGKPGEYKYDYSKPSSETGGKSEKQKSSVGKSESADIKQPTKEQSTKESKKAKRMERMVGLISREKSISDEAGSSSLSDEDARKYSDYLETINTPEGFDAWVKEERERRQKEEDDHGTVDDKTIDELDENLREELCGKDAKISTRGAHKGKKTCPEFKKLYESIATKGGPPDNAVTGNYPADMVYPEGHSKSGQPHPNAGKSKKDVRYKNVLKSYLETGGVCPITKEVVPLQDMQLDHIVSLNNGGKDEPGNWMFTKSNINQFKSAKENPAIQADLEEVLNMTDEEWETKEAEDKFKNYKKNEQREFWKSQFAKGAAHPTEEQLNKMSKDEVDAFIYAYNETVSEDEQISRYGTQKKEVTLKNGEKIQLTYARGEGGNAIQPIDGKPETWGLYVDEDTGEVKQNPEFAKSYKAASKKYKSARGSGGRGKTKKDSIDAIKKKGLVTKLKDDKATNETVDKALKEHRGEVSDSPEKERLDTAKEKVKKLEKDGKITGGVMKKKVDTQMKQWDKDNPPPTESTKEIDNPEAGEPYEPKIPPKPDESDKEAMYNWEKTKEREERKATLIDKDGKPLKTTKKEKLPVGKDDKLTKAGKRSRAYKDWEKERDKQEYHYYRKEFYDTFGQE